MLTASGAIWVFGKGGAYQGKDSVYVCPSDEYSIKNNTHEPRIHLMIIKRGIEELVKMITEARARRTVRTLARKGTYDLTACQSEE